MRDFDIRFDLSPQQASSYYGLNMVNFHPEQRYPSYIGLCRNAKNNSKCRSVPINVGVYEVLYSAFTPNSISSVEKIIHKTGGWKNYNDVLQSMQIKYPSSRLVGGDKKSLHLENSRYIIYVVSTYNNSNVRERAEKNTSNLRIILSDRVISKSDQLQRKKIDESIINRETESTLNEIYN